MSTFQKQLIIHRIPLPKELICIIKDYAFIDITTKLKKDIIMYLINTSIWVGRCMTTYNLSGGIFVFCINSYKTDKSLARFGTTFCIKCGNY